MNFKKAVVVVSVLLGLAAVPAFAQGEFLECVGNSADGGYPVPQPSPTDSVAPAPAPSASASVAPSPVARDVTASPIPGPSSTAPGLYGVFIKPERHNQGMLSADIYLLTPRGGWIKQVAHAEVDPSSDGQTYQSDPISPFAFQLAISQGQASLVQAMTFSGENLANMPLNCHGMRHDRD